jgi:hypothetical protein
MRYRGNVCSPHAAKRNAGLTPPRRMQFPNFAALHPGYSLHHVASLRHPRRVCASVTRHSPAWRRQRCARRQAARSQMSQIPTRSAASRSRCWRRSFARCVVREGWGAKRASSTSTTSRIFSRRAARRRAVSVSVVPVFAFPVFDCRDAMRAGSIVLAARNASEVLRPAVLPRDEGGTARRKTLPVRVCTRAASAGDDAGEVGSAWRLPARRPAFCPAPVRAHRCACRKRSGAHRLRAPRGEVIVPHGRSPAPPGRRACEARSAGAGPNPTSRRNRFASLMGSGGVGYIFLG